MRGRSFRAPFYLLALLIGSPGLAAPTATVKVASEPEALNAQAVISVNGKAIGAPPLSLSLHPGRYLVQVESPGFEPWRKWLDVKAGDSLSLAAKLEPQAAAAGKPAGGSLLVASDDLGAEVFIDRRPYGKVPVLATELAPGAHDVELRAPNGRSERRRVAVEAGKTTKLTVALAKSSSGPATLRVLADPEGVTVWVNREERGQAPVTLEGMDPGNYLVEGRKEGMMPAKVVVGLSAGASHTVKLALKDAPARAQTGSLRVSSAVEGAEVYLDGTGIGRAPLERGEIVAGPHVVRAVKEGYDEFMVTVEVKPEETAEVAVELHKAQAARTELPPAAVPRVERDWSRTTSYAAQLVPPRQLTGDVSLGFPHLFELRLTTGIVDNPRVGMDGGVDLRTYGAVTEVAGRLRMRLVEHGPWAAGAMIAVGGGGGPKSRSTFLVNLGAIGSVLIKKRVNVSAGATINIYSDRHCPVLASSNELDLCSRPPAGITATEVRERFAGLRLLLRAGVEVPITRWLNVFGLLDLAPFQANREAYSDPYAAIMPSSDPGIYGRVGITLKR